MAHMQYVGLLLQNKLVLISSQVDTKERIISGNNEKEFIVVATKIGGKIEAFKILK